MLSCGFSPGEITTLKKVFDHSSQYLDKRGIGNHNLMCVLKYDKPLFSSTRKIYRNARICSTKILRPPGGSRRSARIRPANQMPSGASYYDYGRCGGMQERLSLSD